MFRGPFPHNHTKLRMPLCPNLNILMSAGTKLVSWLEPSETGLGARLTLRCTGLFQRYTTDVLLIDASFYRTSSIPVNTRGQSDRNGYALTTIDSSISSLSRE